MTMRKLTIITADGTINTQTMKRVDLSYLQELVGGDIEQVPHFGKYEGRKCRAWCNDEGRCIPLPINAVASELWAEQVMKQPKSPVFFGPDIFGTLVIEQTEKTENPNA
jgi:hypothetical protein